MSLESILKIGRVEKEFDVFTGLQVKLHTLSAAEQQQALSAVPESLEGGDVARFAYIQRALLVHATDHINKEQLSHVDLHKIYSEMQDKIFQEIFNCYVTLSQEQNSLIDELKKK